jgi:hypothetical protein
MQNCLYTFMAPWYYSSLSQRGSLHVGSPLALVAFVLPGCHALVATCTQGILIISAGGNDRLLTIGCAAWLSVLNLHACHQGHPAMCLCVD